MKIISIVGARPNFIKIDPSLEQEIWHTGQHSDYEMSEIFFKGLKLPEPTVNLGCKGSEVGKMIDKLRTLLVKHQPDMVIVYGDTNSSLAGAMAASQLNIHIAHVESGLRSGDMTMPEEKNRVIIDRLAYLRFCPSNYAETNLRLEGIKDNIFVVGDPLFDALGRFTPIKKTKDSGKYMLLTVHRNFNADSKEALENVFKALKASKKRIIFPCHPRTLASMNKFGIVAPKNVKIIKPTDYKTMLSLISNSSKVITDSGGVQREAFWMNRPVIILREQTEWKEIMGKGDGYLTGTDDSKILWAIENFKGTISAPPEPGVNKRIKDIIYKFL